MAARVLTRPPRIAPLYLRAIVPMLPGASRLPGLPGGGGEIPGLELALRDVEVERGRLAAYARACGYTVEEELPVAYPHVLAFPLHMALLADGGFPFAAVGLVHVENEITQHRPLRSRERLSLAVRATPLRQHPRGRTFTFVTEVRVGDELVWEERSTMLRRGGGVAARSGAGDREALADGDPSAASVMGDRRSAPATSNGSAETTDEHEPAANDVQWRVAGDVGRRYGAVSGDRNPIHLYALSAKAFGFPRAIAHGMWTKARCLAALQAELPDAYTVTVRFRKPVLLPGSVSFGADHAGEAIRFALRSAAGDVLHLLGRIEPLNSPTADGGRR